MDYIVLAFILALAPAQQPKLLAPFKSLVECQKQADTLAVQNAALIQANSSQGGMFVCLVATPKTI